MSLASWWWPVLGAVCGFNGVPFTAKWTIFRELEDSTNFHLLLLFIRNKNKDKENRQWVIGCLKNFCILCNWVIPRRVNNVNSSPMNMYLKYNQHPLRVLYSQEKMLSVFLFQKNTWEDLKFSTFVSLEWVFNWEKLWPSSVLVYSFTQPIFSFGVSVCENKFQLNVLLVPIFLFSIIFFFNLELYPWN